MTGICWGLLAVWLFLGGVAFAEELQLWDETSTQDEAALAELADALIPDRAPSEDLIIHEATGSLPPPIFDNSSSGMVPRDSALMHGSPSLRTHQRVLVYRI